MSTLSALNNIEKAISFSDMMNMSELENLKNYKLAVELLFSYSNFLKVIEEDDLLDLSIESIISKIHILMSEEKYEVIVIDQFENIKGADEISDIIPIKLKSIAKKFNVPLIVQAQLNKASVTNAQTSKGSIDYKKLGGNSLKGTSSLEHQSSNILILTPLEERKTMYGYDARRIKITQPKSRYGSQDSCECWFIGQLNIFIDCYESNTQKTNETSKVVILDD